MFVMLPSIINAKILMQPYLQAVTQDSVCVMAECDSKNDVWVRYGESVSYTAKAKTGLVRSTTDNSFVHRIFIKGLKPGMVYHYSALQDNMNWSEDRTFKTAPLPGTAVRAAWMADFRTGVDIHDAIAKQVLALNPDVSIYGGDLCMDGKEYHYFKEEFFRPAELELISRVPFFNAVGNHEKWEKNTRAFLQASKSPSKSQSYYSFDYGVLHVLVLDNYDPDGYGPGTPQYDFAVRDAKQAKAPWKIVASHNPTYSGDVKHGNDPEMIELAEKAFEPAGFNLALAGHAHIYQHNNDGKMDFFVIGSVGAPIYPPNILPMSIKSAGTYCYAVIDADAKSLTLNSYNEKGELIENFTLHK